MQQSVSCRHKGGALRGAPLPEDRSRKRSPRARESAANNNPANHGSLLWRKIFKELPIGERSFEDFAVLYMLHSLCGGLCFLARRELPVRHRFFKNSSIRHGRA